MIYFSETQEASLKDCLASQAERWQYLGHPALLERFVLRNGHEGIAQARPKGVRKRKDKECFSNSARYHLSREGEAYHYVEGYAQSKHGFIVHHAWLEDDACNVLDLTWRNPEQCRYFGVTFDIVTLTKQLVRHNVYGLLDHGWNGLNAELMFEIDPELREICDQITTERRERRSPVYEATA